MINEAFRGLYPDKYEGRYQFDLNYSGRFKGYNANIHYSRNRYVFNLSRQWYNVSKDIQIGLIQSLFNKALKTKINTTNIELYELFLKNIHLAVPKDKVDPTLKISFDRVNEKYFGGMMSMPNLVMGSHSVRKFGSYEYGTDTISISRVLLDDEELLDFVMYHELLHKKYKYYTKNGKSYHHTGEFKKKEKEYANFEEMERRLQAIANSRKPQKKKSKVFTFLDYFN